MRDNASATGSSMVTMLLVFVSSACCIGPLMVVFSFVGLSMTTVLSIENIFGPYRLLILAATRQGQNGITITVTGISETMVWLIKK